MLHHHVVEVSMESTSVYWIPIWRVLSPYFKLNLANPYFIKQLPCRKSDVKDAQCNKIAERAKIEVRNVRQEIGEINKKYKLGYEKPSVDDIQGWIDAANK